VIAPVGTSAPSPRHSPAIPGDTHVQHHRHHRHLAGRHRDPARGWDRLADTDGSRPSGWFASSGGEFRLVVLQALVYRNWTTEVWIAPARLGDRVSHRTLRATWHTVAAGDPDRARTSRLLDVIDRGLQQAFRPRPAPAAGRARLDRDAAVVGRGQR
jgi:hypothetical protein